MLNHTTTCSSEREEKRLLPSVPLADFNQKLAGVLPKLIAFLCSDELRSHPVWGSVIPYHVPTYGTGESLGHCIRPDVLLTAEGPKLCELDFVPSGRGFLLAALDAPRQSAVLDVFARWYRAMGVSRVLYATASTTVCREETELFASLLREHAGLSIEAGNIDQTTADELADVFIDRLFYRSEMDQPAELKRLAGYSVATAEPFLDSKAIFAMIHDKSVARQLRKAVGEDGLSFLRSVTPQTMLVSSLQGDMARWKIAEEYDRWVIKGTEVEADHTWGARSTLVGANYNKVRFLDALRAEYPEGKHPGEQPILQAWSPSKDFWQVWDGVVAGLYKRSSLTLPGVTHDARTYERATRHVGARIGFYFLVVRATGECFTTPYGDLVLRQNRLVHGARDAICLSVRAD